MKKCCLLLMTVFSFCFCGMTKGFEYKIFLDIQYSKAFQSHSPISVDEANRIIAKEISRIHTRVRVVPMKEDANRYIYIAFDVGDTEGRFLACVFHFVRAKPGDLLRGCEDISTECYANVDKQIGKFQFGRKKFGPFLFSGNTASVEETLKNMGLTISYLFEP